MRTTPPDAGRGAVLGGGRHLPAERHYPVRGAHYPDAALLGAASYFTAEAEPGGMGGPAADCAGGGYAGGDPSANPAIPPRLLKSRQPSYPSSARSASIEGTTTVRILVGYDGEVESVVVAESSGNAALDAAAVDACYGWRFSGAKNGIGQKIRCYTYVPITFRLRSI